MSNFLSTHQQLIQAKIAIILAWKSDFHKSIAMNANNFLILFYSPRNN